MPIGSRKLTAYTNKYRSGSSSQYPSPTISVEQTVDNLNVTYSITSNITTEPTLYYAFEGNIAADDFADAVVSANIALDSNGNATVTKTLLANVNVYDNKEFTFNLYSNYTSPNPVYTGNTFTCPLGDAPFVLSNISTFSDSNSTTYYDSVYYNSNVVVATVGSYIMRSPDRWIGQVNGLPANTSIDAYARPIWFEVDKLSTRANDLLEVYIIGAGGGGTWQDSLTGGGGGGGVVYLTFDNSNIATGNYSGTVGHGGFGSVRDIFDSGTQYVEMDAFDGGNTTFMGVTVYGGKAPANMHVGAGNYVGGDGGTCSNISLPGYVQGAGGGGGINSAGGAGSNPGISGGATTGGNGGNGPVDTYANLWVHGGYFITGGNAYVSGGGGGFNADGGRGAYTNGTQGANVSTDPIPNVPATGYVGGMNYFGAGGGDYDYIAGRPGGSGTVIVRYPTFEATRTLNIT